MGLFKCRLCGKVFATNFQSSKKNLCIDCFMKLEDMYTRARIHDYIRDHGLDENFDIDELAHELRMNPKNVELLYNMGFFDRDMQVYTRDNHRKELAEEFKNELDKIGRTKSLEQEKRQPPPHRTKFISYGGRIYNRKRF